MRQYSTPLSATGLGQDMQTPRRPYPRLWPECADGLRAGGRGGVLLGGLADGRHVEVGHSDGRHDRTVEVVVPLPAEGQLGRTDLGDPTQELDRRVVEAEVVDSSDHLPVLDEIDPIACQPGE